jgi:acetyl esterase
VVSTAGRGPLLSEQAEVLAGIAALGEPDLTELTPAEARAARDARPAAEPLAVHAVEDLPAGALGPVPVRVLRSGPDPAPVVVWVHGGGWVMGSWTTHDGVLRSLVRRTGAHVVAPDYRLAPEHPFPAGLDDSIATVAAVLDHGGDFGFDTTHCVLGGDSAGGNLAAVSALEVGAGLAGLVLAYPVTDCRLDSPSYVEDQHGSYLTPAWMRWFRDHYLPDAELALDWRASPLLAPDDRLAALPPTYVLVASHDPLRHEGLALARRVSDSGGVVVARTAEGLTHGFLGWERQIAAAGGWFEDLAGFVRNVVSSDDQRSSR